MSSENCPKWPCSGIRVVEVVSSNVAGPFAAQILGDMGAEVIKLEGMAGDVMRAVPPFKDRRSGQFFQFNRNKRSVAVDLKQEEGLEIARTLIDRADVLVENSRPGVTKRLGIDYESVKVRNPELIYTSINGFGSTGPYSHIPAYDMVIQGLVGFMPVQADPGQAPMAVRSVIVDKITSIFAATSILGALLRRANGGGGQKIEVRMMDAFAAFILPDLIAAKTFAGDVPHPLPSPSLYRPMRTADGHVIGFISTAGQFEAICRALDRTDLLEDERFATPALRFANMDALLDALEEKTSRIPTRKVLDLLWSTGEIPIAPVNSIEEFLCDPQALHNRTTFKMDGDKAGPIWQVGRFANHVAPDLEDFTPAPDLGEHSREVMRDLGYGNEQIDRLFEKKVIV